jgi:pentapeptide MXKDX repeat protein
MEDVERDLILETLGHTLGNRTHAATILGISIRALRNKLRDYAAQGLAVTPPAMGQGAMGQGAMGQGAMGQGAMGQGAMGQGAMGQGAMGQGLMGQGAMGAGVMGQGGIGTGQAADVLTAIPPASAMAGAGVLA